MRADLDVETLLRVILVLIVVILVLEVIQETVGTISSIFGFVPDLLVKRLGTDRDDDLDHRIERVRETLRGVAPFAVRITGVDWFPAPETGTGPVVYLDVESPALVGLHGALCEVIEPVAHMEGEAYVAHVTIARGGDPETARRLTERDLEARRYTVDELVVRDAHRDVATTRFSLPV